MKSLSQLVLLRANWPKIYPIAVILAVFLLVFAANFSSSNILIGWDNRQQELSPLLNLKRYIFSVWQEYQGLGLLAGHAHASEIPHAIFIFLLSLIFPLAWIRQIFVFLMLFTGPLGMYFLVKKLAFYENEFLNKYIPLMASLFYLLNLGTVQIFYAPLEPFIVQFAFLPWLFLVALNLLAKGGKKNLLYFILVNILAIPQAQIPTVFIVYIFSLSFFFFVLFLETKNKEIVRKFVKILLITLLINAFWILPFVYFYLTNGSVAFEAKINQMSTETIFQQNKEFGDIFDVMLLKGFWFQNVDPNLQGNFTYMMLPWKEYLNTVVSFLGYLLFATCLIGFLYVKRKAPFVIPFSALFVLAFTMLAANTLPFSVIDFVLRQIPLFNEIFRFPFTKFIALAILTYSFFFAIGVGKIYLTLERHLKTRGQVIYSLIPVFIVLLIFFSFPIFKGNLFYNKEKLKIPEEYQQTFDFFKAQNPNTRIANLPQISFWGWSFYSWGYGGSGFLWYGIPQPILDRAFDVWSGYDENYYWEISYAIHSKNPRLFEEVLNKYQINYLLVDKNIINPSSPKALFTKETDQLLSQMPSVHKKVSFGKIDIYEISLKNQVTNFVYLAGKNSTVNSYNWSNLDLAYLQNSDYITSAKSDILYPFRSLFSGKNQENKEFIQTLEGNHIVISKKLDKEGKTRLNIPPISATDITVGFKVLKNSDGSAIIQANLETPQIYIGKEKIWGQSLTRPLFLVPADGPRQFNLTFNTLDMTVNLDSDETELGRTKALEGQNLAFVTSYTYFQVDMTNDVNSLLNQPSEINVDLNNGSDFKVEIPKITDESLSFIKSPSEDTPKKVKNCENFRKGSISSGLEDNLISLSSQNATACLSLYSPFLPHQQGYSIFVENENSDGRPLHFWVLNEDQQTSVLDTYLPKNYSLETSDFIVPSYEEFGQGYSFNFESISIADRSWNKLGKLSVFPIPYDFLTSLYFGNGIVRNPAINTKLEVAHPNESLYVIKGDLDSRDTLVLSQAFDNGWQAYRVSSDNFLTESLPFLFGKNLSGHVKVNNWENGWSALSDSGVTIIIYLPQYLEYIGLAGLIIAGLIFGLKELREKNPFLSA